MPTLEDALKWLKGLGMDVPSDIVNAWLEIALDLESCFTANGYAPSVQKLIVLHLLALYGLSAGNRYISSQSAPSGASRSFRYADLANAWRGQMGMLKLLDKNGCANGLIPSPPVRKNIGIGIAIGDCRH